LSGSWSAIQRSFAGQSPVALVGPCADDPLPFLRCYSYPKPRLGQYPELGLGIEVPTLRQCLVAELEGATVVHEPGCPIREPDRSGIEPAVHAVRAADVCIAVVGDLPGLFGRGTSGEGCDAEDLSLPRVQADLLEALLCDWALPRVGRSEASALLLWSGAAYGRARAQRQRLWCGGGWRTGPR
jgi:hypothetical protein